MSKAAALALLSDYDDMLSLLRDAVQDGDPPDWDDIPICHNAEEDVITHVADTYNSDDE